MIDQNHHVLMSSPSRRVLVRLLDGVTPMFWYLVSGLVYCASPIAYPIVNEYSPSGTRGPRTSTGGFGYSPSGARAPRVTRKKEESIEEDATNKSVTSTGFVSATPTLLRV